jgi:hypothetical protein
MPIRDRQSALAGGSGQLDAFQYFDTQFQTAGIVHV